MLRLAPLRNRKLSSCSRVSWHALSALAHCTSSKENNMDLQHFACIADKASTKLAPDDEIVEDSEPEREMLRELQKDRRRVRRGTRKQKTKTRMSIIEISSDSHDERATRKVELGTRPARMPGFEPRSVIVIPGLHAAFWLLFIQTYAISSKTTVTTHGLRKPTTSKTNVPQELSTANPM